MSQTTVCTVNILKQTAEITDSEMSQTTVCTVNILKQTAEITDSEMSDYCLYCEYSETDSRNNR